jgi:Glycosyltransferase family 87
MRRSRAMHVVPWLRVAAIAAAVLHLAPRPLASAVPSSTEDYWRYWVGWHRAWEGANPYAADALAPWRQHVPGLDATWIGLYTPPWALPLVTPFAPFPYETSRVLWLLANVALLLMAATVLWRVFRGPAERVTTAWMIALLTMPSLLLVRQGQIDAWIVAGLVGFLYWTREESRRDLAAGACLALASVKPQLLLGLWITLVPWVLSRRRFTLAAGFAGAIGVGLVLPSVRNGAVLRDFVQAYATHAPAEYATPTLGYLLRLALGTDRFSLQFVAPVAVGAWAVAYWTRHRATWTWGAALPPILWVSVLGASYAWMYDHVVLLVPILAVAAALLRDGNGRSAATWLGGLAALNVATFWVHREHTDEFFVWFAPALLLWWWGARRAVARGTARAQGAAAAAG